MNSKEDIQKLIHFFQDAGGDAVQVNEDAVLKSMHQEGSQASLSIKVFSVLGGFFASLAFLLFLMFAELYNSGIGLSVVGSLLVAVYIWIKRVYDTLVMDTISISVFIIGFILLYFDCRYFQIDEQIICFLFILIALLSLWFVQNQVQSFVSVLIIHGCILSLINLNNAYDLIQVYTCLLALFIFLLFVNEASILSRYPKMTHLYKPVWIGLVLSFLFTLSLLRNTSFLAHHIHYVWISALFFIGLILFLQFKLGKNQIIVGERNKIFVYSLTILALIPTIFTPGISGALFLVLLSYYMNFRTSFFISIAAFIYFICQFYYDLQFTLLVKSFIMIGCGVVFLATYFINTKKLKSNAAE